MAQAVNQAIVANEAIISKIYLIRGQKMMMDRDLAELYGVETKQLKRQVKRNIDRFPEDLMFELNEEEFQHWRRQIGTSNKGDKMGLRYAPGMMKVYRLYFKYLKQLLIPVEQVNRERIGFRRLDEKN